MLGTNLGGEARRHPHAQVPDRRACAETRRNARNAQNLKPRPHFGQVVEPRVAAAEAGAVVDGPPLGNRRQHVLFPVFIRDRRLAGKQEGGLEDGGADAAGAGGEVRVQ